jgi:hypothetical protein
MARWKGAGVIAAAILSFVVVKAVPWALGFAGGKYLYETAMGATSPAAQTLTAVQVSEQLQSQEYQIFKAIKQEFPDDYNEIVQKITAIAKLGGSADEVRKVSQVSVADLRHRYAPLLPSAPESNASESLGAQLDMLRHVMARESAVTCNSYLAKGPSVLSARDHDLMMDMDKIGTTLIHAFGAARSSGLSAATVNDQDWSMVADAFTKAGGTPAEMEAIASANREYEGLCPALAKFYEAALSLEGEPGRHVKTALLYEIAKN